MTRLIDADAIEKVLKEKHFNRVLDSDRWLIAEIKKGIMDLPTIDAVPVRHGKWIESDEYDEYRGRLYRCSNCNTFVVSDFDNYCPYCGSRMDEE